MKMLYYFRMKNTLFILLTIFLFLSPSFAMAKSPVIEESYWHVDYENRDLFLENYSKYWKPFWEEVRKKDWVEDGIRIYAHRIHTKGHIWTFKTVVKFKTYESIDKWLENRDNMVRKIFPQFQSYKEMSHELKKLTNDDEHWDEFIRELNP